MADENTNQTGAEDAVAAVKDADADQLAAMVGSVTDEQLEEGMANLEARKMVLSEIFKRMADHVEPSKIEGTDAIVHFNIADDNGSDTYEVVIKDGKITTSDEPKSENPRVTISAAPVSFLKLASGQESGPAMFMTGKLKLKGDLMFASQLTSFFRIPSASRDR